AFSHREDTEQWAQLQAAGCKAILYSGVSSEGLSAVLSSILSERRVLLDKQPHEAKPERHVAASAKPAPDLPNLADFASDNPSMQAFLDIVHRVVDADTTLLIQGETGVGKERLARAIHNASPREQAPFVAINCGGLPETLLESELFGHEKGAFTGAIHTRRGCFELAHKGTLFLDEIGEMSSHFQVKLLRVLEERKVRR